MTAAVDRRARPFDKGGPTLRVALDVVECVVCTRRYGALYPDLGVVVHQPGTASAYQCRLPGPPRRRQR